MKASGGKLVYISKHDVGRSQSIGQILRRDMGRPFCEFYTSRRPRLSWTRLTALSRLPRDRANCTLTRHLHRDRVRNAVRVFRRLPHRLPRTQAFLSRRGRARFPWHRPWKHRGTVARSRAE